MIWYKERSVKQVTKSISYKGKKDLNCTLKLRNPIVSKESINEWKVSQKPEKGIYNI